MEIYKRPKEPNLFGVRVADRLYPAFVERLRAEGGSRNSLVNRAIALYLSTEQEQSNIEKTPA